LVNGVFDTNTPDLIRTNIRVAFAGGGSDHVGVIWNFRAGQLIGAIAEEFHAVVALN
jgi:hypothetical protein